jgi:hypothetical protein
MNNAQWSISSTFLSFSQSFLEISEFAKNNSTLVRISNVLKIFVYMNEPFHVQIRMDHTIMSSIRGGRVLKLGINNNNNNNNKNVLIW